MGATSARRAASIVENTAHILAVEALAAAQALELRAPLEPARGTRAALEAIRRLSPFVEDDRPLSSDIEAVASALREGALVGEVEGEIGALA